VLIDAVGREFSLVNPATQGQGRLVLAETSGTPVRQRGRDRPRSAPAGRADRRAAAYARLTSRSRATGSCKSGPVVTARVFLCRNLRSTPDTREQIVRASTPPDVSRDR
jgi:hypothetical protein